MLEKGLLEFKNELISEMSLGSSIQGLVEKIHSLISKPIVITNASSMVIACAFNDEDLTNEYIKICSFEPSSGQGFFCYEDTIMKSFIYPIRINNSLLGYLIIQDVDTQDKSIRLLGEQAVNILALEILQQQRLNYTEKQYKEAFIFDLLYGNIDLKEDILSRGEIWKWNLLRPHRVIVFEQEDYNQHTMDSMLVMLAQIISTEIIKMNEDPILLRKKGEVIVILATEKETNHQQRAYKNMFVKKVLEIAGEMIPTVAVRVGAGRIYNDISEIFRSYQESKVALLLGQIMNIKHTTPSFEELGLTRILYNHDHQELLEFYKEVLGDLERHDNEQKGQLLNTIEKYLLYRCDLKAAADVLFLHPNTLRYRLKKIEEILDIDLNDFDTKLNLMAAFKIVYLLKSAGTEVKNIGERL